MNTFLTPYFLMQGIADAMRNVFKDVYMGDNREQAVNVFEQALPISTSADDMPEFAPYCIVRISDGSILEANGSETVNVLLLFCVMSEQLDMRGYADVLHLMQMAKQYLLEHSVISRAFCIVPESIQWSLQQEESHPYYLGGITLSYHAPAIIRNEVNYD